jgi:HPt (histidine-containing phosphotransfer) domain-containing protein
MPDDGAAFAATRERFDGAALERLMRFGGAALLHRMTEMFAADVPHRFERMRRAAALADAAGVGAVAHSLKSTAAQLGLVALSSRCARIESLCVAGKLDNARGDLAAAEDELSLDIEWLRAMSAKVKP